VKINRLIIIHLMLCFSFVLHVQVNSQTTQLSRDFNKAQFQVSQLLWGTRWNSFVCETRMNTEPSVWLGCGWSGWEAFSSSRVWAGKELKIFHSDSGISIVGWTLLGGEFQRLREIGVVQLGGVSELGMAFALNDGVKTGKLQAQLINAGEEWRIRGFLNISEASLMSFGAGMRSDLSGYGWALFFRKRMNNVEFTIDIAGPQFYFSCGFIRFGKVQSAMIHKQGVSGGSTHWSFKW